MLTVRSTNTNKHWCSYCRQIRHHKLLQQLLRALDAGIRHQHQRGRHAVAATHVRQPADVAAQDLRTSFVVHPAIRAKRVARVAQLDDVLVQGQPGRGE